MARLFIVISIVFLLPLSATYAQTNSILEEVRSELFYSTFDLEKCTQFYNKIVNSGETNATLTAYQAAAKALIAKYTWNPVTKINSLKNVEELLTNAINKEKDNLEIRFLRFYIQNSIPSYLGYSKNLKEDADILRSNITSVDKMKLDRGISDYIIAYVQSIEQAEPKKKMKSGVLTP